MRKKKKKIIIFSIISVVTAITFFCLGAAWYYDNSREMENSYIYVKEWYPTTQAISLKDNVDSIIFTVYPNTFCPVRAIRTYTIKNNVVTSIVDEMHFKNKFDARNYVKNNVLHYKDFKVQGNIITGYVENGEIGQTKSDIFDGLKKLENIFTVVKE